MKKLLFPFSLSLLALVCSCNESHAKQSASNEESNSPQVECKCDGNEKTPEIKEEPSKWKKFAGEAAKIGGAALAGAVVANKLHCDRFDIEVEYILLDACLHSCSGVAEKSSRLSKCAKAIQDMECSQKLPEDKIKHLVNDSCPLQ